ncbi:MAG: hypothetical protein A2140_06770 [Candidatus Muproteobacteria bacterium RBG_16_62_13]|uniref:Lipoprotein n=1 Tax=Candidatus Muproteobacteria bacterium RBG_16_62_13 TaxID=1817756 RepID=A0A1F6T361_9PROT|nr:MAG: hypothetical protein A2140_06770 [Candidatus Muproteobacteria bacterium RBG_16_62_13]
MSINLPRTFLILAAALLLTACVEKTPLTSEQMPCAGYWVGQDGRVVHIWANGGGDFKVQGKKVTGGRAEITGDRLKIGLWFIEQEWRITKAPYRIGSADEMMLDNQVFRRRGAPACD